MSLSVADCVQIADQYAVIVADRDELLDLYRL